MVKRCFLAILMMMIGVCAAHAERMTVDVSTANIRSGPGTNYDILWKVEQYHPIEVIRKSGDWIYFRDFEGDKGWVFDKLVKPFSSVIVIKDKCNVRSGPGTNHDIVFTVERGVPFKVLERKGDWLHIQHADGDKGWIHKMLVW